MDTSGSIGTQELEQFAGEINAIINEAQPESIGVIYCDAAVPAVDEFGPSEAIKLSPKGGGGTDFVPPFRWVEENGVESPRTAPSCGGRENRTCRILMYMPRARGRIGLAGRDEHAANSQNLHE